MLPPVADAMAWMVINKSERLGGIWEFRWWVLILHSERGNGSSQARSLEVWNVAANPLFEIGS